MTIQRARLGRRPHLVAIALGLASLLVTALPGVTSAAIHLDDAVRRTRVVKADPAAVTQAAATCPSGMRVVGGGAAFVGPGLSPGSGVHPYLYESSPTPNGRGWRGAGTVLQDALLPMGTELTLLVTVLCRPASEVGQYTIVVREQPDDKDGLATTTADCGRGKRIVAGGAAWRDSGSGGHGGWSVLLVSAPRPNGRSWHAIGYTIKGSMDTLRVVLLCRPADALPGLSVRTHDIASGAPVRAGRVSCPAGMRATTGGLEWIKDGKLDFRGLLTSSRTTLDGKGWYVAATADDPEITARMRVLCLPR